MPSPFSPFPRRKGRDGGRLRERRPQFIKVLYHRRELGGRKRRKNKVAISAANWSRFPPRGLPNRKEKKSKTTGSQFFRPSNAFLYLSSPPTSAKRRKKKECSLGTINNNNAWKRGETVFGAEFLPLSLFPSCSFLSPSLHLSLAPSISRDLLLKKGKTTSHSLSSVDVARS